MSDQLPQMPLGSANQVAPDSEQSQSPEQVVVGGAREGEFVELQGQAAADALTRAYAALAKRTLDKSDQRTAVTHDGTK